MGTATAWQCARETVALLAARAPKLGDALAAARKAAEHAFVVLDGTLIPIDWVAADRPFYSGKHRLLWAPIAVGTVAIAWLRQPRTPRLAPAADRTLRQRKPVPAEPTPGPGS